MSADTLLVDGWIVNVALAFVVIEIGLLWLYRSRTGRGLRLAGVLPNLLAGSSLMLALRASLVGSAAGMVLFWLFLSLIFHLLDIRSRWPN